MRDRPNLEGCGVEGLPIKPEFGARFDEGIMNTLLAAAANHNRWLDRMPKRITKANRDSKC